MNDQDVWQTRFVRELLVLRCLRQHCQPEPVRVFWHGAGPQARAVFIERSSLLHFDLLRTLEVPELEDELTYPVALEMPVWGLAVDLGFVLHRETLAGQKRPGQNCAVQVLYLVWIANSVFELLADLALVPLRQVGL